MAQNHFNANEIWFFSKFEFFIYSGIKDFLLPARLNTWTENSGVAPVTGRFEERPVYILFVQVHETK